MSTDTSNTSEQPEQAPTAQPPAEATPAATGEAVPAELREAIAQANTFASTLIAATQQANKVQAELERTADAAKSVEKDLRAAATGEPSLGATMLNAALWSGTAFLVGWGLNKLLKMAEESAEAHTKKHRWRGTEEATTEPTQAATAPAAEARA